MRPAKKGRIGTIMVTPPKLPANDNLPPLMRTVLYVDRPARPWRGHCVVASLDARMQVLRLLAEFPEVRVNGAKGVLYDAVEAAELDEPGAMAALIELKLSANAQFQPRRSDHGAASGGLPRQLSAAGPASFARLPDLTRNGRSRRHAKNQGQNQDRAATPAQGHPDQ
jgi:hypothetical protein